MENMKSTIEGASSLKALRILEYVIASVMVLITIWSLVTLIMAVHWFTPIVGHKAFHHELEQILSDIILIVVSVELAMLLIHRKIEMIIDIVIFVIARKMIVSASIPVDILMNVAGICALFGVRKYLLVCPGCLPIPFKNSKES